MTIDAHQHFWQYDPVAYDWIGNEMPGLRQDFLPPQLAPLLQQAGFTGSVAVQALQTEAETEFLLALAGRYSLGWVDLQADDAAARLTRLALNPYLKGIRHVVQAEQDDRFLLRPAFLRGISLLQQFNLTYDLLIYPHQLPAAIEFVARFPEQPFVLDHLAKPLIKKQQLDPWAQHIRELARHPHVCCKLSGMVTEADWHHWHPEHFTPYLQVVAEAFGPDRLMLGSDWPVCTLAGNYNSVMQIGMDFIRQYSIADQQKITGGNARKFYNLAPDI
jgi:L-fuconolactonase